MAGYIRAAKGSKSMLRVSSRLQFKEEVQHDLLEAVGQSGKARELAEDRGGVRQIATRQPIQSVAHRITPYSVVGASEQAVPYLGHVTEAALHLAGGRLAAPEHLAGVGLEHAQSDSHGGGLARPVGADEAHDLALGHLEREPVEGNRLTVEPRESLEGQHPTGTVPGVYLRRNALMRSA